MHVLTAVIVSTFALGGAPRGELLDFSAKWCGPCQQMGPIVDRLHRQGYAVRKIDIDENRELARKYNISSIPAFVLVVDGKVAEQIVGMQSEQTLLRMLAKIPKPAPEFDMTKQDASLLVSNGQTNSQPPSAPKWKPAPKSKPGILAPFFSSKKGSAGSEVAQQGKSLKQDIRGNIENDSREINLKAVLARQPIEASVRIRVVDPQGTNLGSGTIIDSKVGHTLILTCGHVFRNFEENSLVEVDLFVKGQKETIIGKHVRHDLQLDLGLISIATDNPLPFARIASGSYRVEQGAVARSVGCDQGNDPTTEKHSVTGVNKYEGPSDLIECTGVPLQGRSGGGLFNSKGELIGICMAADERGLCGLYVGLLAVQGFLKTCGQPDLLEQGFSPDLEFEESAGTAIADADREPSAERGIAALRAALGDDAEGVICVIKSNQNSLAGQRVVVLPGRRSTEAVAKLNRSLGSGRIQATSMEK